MDKIEIASYLVDLHNLLQAQESTGGTAKSNTLLNEYNKYWVLLKETITKENENETRTG